MVHKATLVFVLSLLLSACTNVFFQPGRTLIRTPDQLGLRYDDVYFTSGDGTKLHGWWLPAAGKAIGTVLFLHGNAENISTHVANVAWLPKEHVNVFLFDYRGYGISSGEVDLDGALADVESALQKLALLPEVNEHGLVIFGQSLGGALAADAAANSAYRTKLRAVILEGSFASYRQIAREKLSGFWLTAIFKWPLSLFVSDSHEPAAALAELKPIPILIIHGERDDIVPVEHAKNLYAAAEEPKQIWMLPNVGHIQALTVPEYRQRFLQYLIKVFAGKE
jgi:uncharacterized protein